MVKAGGKHLIVDYWGVDSAKLTETKEIESILKQGAIEAGATILGSSFHEFGEGYGITGVIILSESHISIHTWPEKEYAAIDIFMCGTCDPRCALKILDTYFVNQYSKTQMIERGEQ